MNPDVNADPSAVSTMTMRHRRGRPASLPESRYTPPPSLVITETTCVVHFYPEEGGRVTSFNFHRFPTHRNLQIAFAKGFQQNTGPSGRWRAQKSAKYGYYSLLHFARFLATLRNPPLNGTEIVIAHLERYQLNYRNSKAWSTRFSAVRNGLLAVEPLSPTVRAWLIQQQLPPREAKHEEASRSYSRTEEQRIIQAARRDLRAAAARIRAGVDLLHRWQDGDINKSDEKYAWEHGYLLNELVTTGDVPRYAKSKKHNNHTWMVVRHGGSSGLIRTVCLTSGEVAAACILLISTTGLNGDAILSATIAHERADGYGNEPHIALVEVIKPRRGRRSRYMRFPFTDLPAWVGVQPGKVMLSESDEVATPFGIYTLLQELTVPARQMQPSPLLFLCAPGKLSTGRQGRLTARIREGLPEDAVPDWGRQVRLAADMRDSEETSTSLDVTMRRLRMTYLQRTQRPVAHTPRTLHDVYLLGDVGGLVESQRIVAEALAEQVNRAREYVRAEVLSHQDVQDILRDPQAAAQRFGVRAHVLKRVVSGRLNTALAACTDYTHSPFAPAGNPCIASFLLCLSCPCARVTPQHLPMLLAACREFEALRQSVTLAIWVSRFARTHAQLVEVIGQFSDAAVEAARADITDADRELAQRLLRRELDLA